MRKTRLRTRLWPLEIFVVTTESVWEHRPLTHPRRSFSCHITFFARLLQVNTIITHCVTLTYTYSQVPLPPFPSFSASPTPPPHHTPGREKAWVSVRGKVVTAELVWSHEGQPAPPLTPTLRFPRTPLLLTLALRCSVVPPTPTPPRRGTTHRLARARRVKVAGCVKCKGWNVLKSGPTYNPIKIWS